MFELEHVDTKGHHFEKDLNEVFVCELCQGWFCPADSPDKEMQERIDKLGPCPKAITPL